MKNVFGNKFLAAVILVSGVLGSEVSWGQAYTPNFNWKANFSKIYHVGKNGTQLSIIGVGTVKKPSGSYSSEAPMQVTFDPGYSLDSDCVQGAFQFYNITKTAALINPNASVGMYSISGTLTSPATNGMLANYIASAVLPLYSTQSVVGQISGMIKLKTSEMV